MQLITITFSWQLGSLDMMTAKHGQNDNAFPLQPVLLYHMILGTKMVLGKTQFHSWLKEFKESLKIAGVTCHVLNSKYKGSTSYADEIKAHNLTYLFYLYHYGMKILGDSATFNEIASAMSEKSRVEEG